MKKLSLSFFITAISFIISLNFTLAAGTEDYPYITTDSPPATKQSNPPNTVSLPNPLTGDKTSKSIPELLGTIINYVMGIIGSLALVMFIYGGITWMLSAGNQEQVGKGKNIIIWAGLGLVIIFMSYVLVRFIIQAIGGAT